MFERPQDSPGRADLFPDDKAAVAAAAAVSHVAESLDRARADRGLRVLPPVLADRPCDLDDHGVVGVAFFLAIC